MLRAYGFLLPASAGQVCPFESRGRNDIFRGGLYSLSDLSKPYAAPVHKERQGVYQARAEKSSIFC
jgi:hypothetical protein